MAEAWTAATRKTFWRVFPTSRMPMFLLDDNAVYTAANAAACQALGRSTKEIVGRQMGFSSAAEQRSQLDRIWVEFQRASSILLPWQIMLPDGVIAEVETMCTRDTPERGQHLALCWRGPSAPGERTLTRREQEVTRLIASGLTGAQIAQRLYLSPGTVRTHVRNAMDHAGASTRAQLVALALTHGLIPGGPVPD